MADFPWRDNATGAVSPSGGLDFFHSQGFVVVPSVVPIPLVERLVAEIGEFLDIDFDRREQWYNGGAAYTHSGSAPRALRLGFASLTPEELTEALTRVADCATG